MPKLMNSGSEQVYKTVSNFQFSAVEMDKLDGTEYTIVQLLVDVSSSVSPFKNELEDAIKTVVDSCQKSPRAENLLFRVATFTTNGGDTVEEIHGFNLLSSINKDDYTGSINPSGMTPLYDAALNAIESLEIYGKTLVEQEYFCNGIFFVITDGWENASRNASVMKIRDSLQNIRKNESLESIKSILIGIDRGDTGLRQDLENFKTDAGFDEYVSLGDVSAGNLAKLAHWVSQSISSTSQALGTGGPSKPVDFSL